MKINEDFWDNHKADISKKREITEHVHQYSLVAITRTQPVLNRKMSSDGSASNDIDIDAVYKKLRYAVKQFTKVIKLLNFINNYSISVNVYKHHNLNIYDNFFNDNVKYSYSIEDFCNPDTIRELFSQYSFYADIFIGMQVDFTVNRNCSKQAFLRNINMYKELVIDKDCFGSITAFLDNDNSKIITTYYSDTKPLFEIDKLYSELFNVEWNGEKELESGLRQSYKKCSLFTQYMMHVNQFGSKYSNKYDIQFIGFEEMKNSDYIKEDYIFVNFKPKVDEAWNVNDIVKFIKEKMILILKHDIKKEHNIIYIYINDSTGIDLSNVKQNPLPLNPDVNKGIDDYNEKKQEYYVVFCSNHVIIPCGRMKKGQTVTYYGSAISLFKAIVNHERFQ